MTEITLERALAERVVLLDGGLATRLEERGHDLSSDLWSARLLVEAPGEIEAAHADYFAAGAEVAITASYQVSYDGMQAVGLDRAETTRLLATSVTLARRAANQAQGQRWVAASVGPYGATLGDGAEYRGDYDLSVAELREWHRPRLAALMAAEPDVLAMETIPCLREVEALLGEIAGSGFPCWLSLTSVGERTRQDEPIAEAFAMAREVAEVLAVGVNCCATEGLPSVIEVARDAAARPVVVYPNSGEGWDGAARWWTGEPAFSAEDAPDWVRAGARLVGGCCRVGVADIARMRELL
jgi:homocysteine S-methyltransferase